MHRRNFLKLSGASIAMFPLFSLPIAGCNSQENRYPLLQDFMPKETIKAIGNEYVQKNVFTNQKVYSNLTKNEAAAMVKKDFEEDRTIIVSGWVLSITEARQCGALVHIKE